MMLKLASLNLKQKEQRVQSHWQGCQRVCNYRFTINQTVYMSEEYSGLKQLFDKSIALHGEAIVFNILPTE